jgi:hypothetical protein
MPKKNVLRVAREALAALELRGNSETKRHGTSGHLSAVLICGYDWGNSFP